MTTRAAEPCPFDGSVRIAEACDTGTLLRCPWCRGVEVVEDTKAMLQREWSA